MKGDLMEFRPMKRGLYRLQYEFRSMHNIIAK
ncbi:hypothetical protein Echvi_4118 [Echinicola vietnamensis DSM 17526]|uniref:Uncharacterized protein n=1 Tax=Echinicola vietnamensis (strain DSM 17526 / LMG 23754 / KMM 6221) TaxID=926556 RepID=L0G642_ECHVK|nr:hypothetical protein Echvi_4118 [Echinicola vietnamensis DSM 17526]